MTVREEEGREGGEGRKKGVSVSASERRGGVYNVQQMMLGAGVGLWLWRHMLCKRHWSG